MRWRPVIVAAALLAAFDAAGADPVAVQADQAPATVGAPTASSATEVAPPKDAAQAAAPATAESASAPSGNPATADAGAASAAPVTLKLTAVPPPADFKIPAGYRAVTRGLDTVYCTSVTPLGTRMPQKYCLTREQLEQVERQAEAERQRLKEKARTGGTSGG